MRLAILGVGLIGGSIGRAARERGLAEVTGYVRNPAKRDECLEVGVVDLEVADRRLQVGVTLRRVEAGLADARVLDRRRVRVDAGAARHRARHARRRA